VGVRSCKNMERLELKAPNCDEEGLGGESSRQEVTSRGGGGLFSGYSESRSPFLNLIRRDLDAYQVTAYGK